MLCGIAAPSAHAAFPGANGKIAFERDNEIFLMNSDGSGAAPLTSDGIAKRDPVVSADGRFVAYGYDRNIWVINSDGGGAHAITTGGANDQSPAFSPDGRKIAFLRGSGDLDIFSVNIDGTGLKNLTERRGRPRDRMPPGHPMAAASRTRDLAARAARTRAACAST